MWIGPSTTFGIIEAHTIKQLHRAGLGLGHGEPLVGLKHLTHLTAHRK